MDNKEFEKLVTDARKKAFSSELRRALNEELRELAWKEAAAFIRKYKKTYMAEIRKEIEKQIRPALQVAVEEGAKKKVKSLLANIKKGWY